MKEPVAPAILSPVILFLLSAALSAQVIAFTRL